MAGLFHAVPESLKDADEGVVATFTDLHVAHVWIDLARFAEGFRLAHHRGGEPRGGPEALDLSIIHADTFALVFFGEEKSGVAPRDNPATSRRLGREGLRNPHSALEDILSPARMSWSAATFGTAPYIFCYTCRGSEFNTYAYSPDLTPGAPPGQATATRVWRTLDLNQLRDRIELVARVFFMFSVTRAIVAAHFPTRAISPEKKWVRVVPGFIEKDLQDIGSRVWGADAGKTKAEWVELLQLVARNGPPSLVGAQFALPAPAPPPAAAAWTPVDATKLRLFPVGFIRGPTNGAEVRVMRTDVLSALAGSTCKGGSTATCASPTW